MKKSINLILMVALFVMGGCAGQLPIEVGDIEIIPASGSEEVLTTPETTEQVATNNEDSLSDTPVVVDQDVADSGDVDPETIDDEETTDTEGIKIYMAELPLTVTMVGSFNFHDVNELPWPQQFDAEQQRVTSVSSWAEIVYSAGNSSDGSGFIKAFNRIEDGELEGLNPHWEQQIAGHNVNVTSSYARSSQLYVTSYDHEACSGGRRPAGRALLNHYDGQFLANPDHSGLVNASWFTEIETLSIGDTNGILQGSTVDFEVTPLDVAVSRDAIYVVGELRVVSNDNTVACNSDSYTDAVVLKYDLDGTRRGYRRYSNAKSALTAVDVAPNGTVFVAGWANGKMALNNGDDHHGGKDILVMHLDSHLEGMRAVRQYGTDKEDIPTDIVAADNQNFYLVGYTRGDLAENGYGKLENDRDAILIHFEIDREAATRNFFSMDAKTVVQYYRDGEQEATAVDFKADKGLVIAGHTRGLFTSNVLFETSYNAFLVTYRDVTNLRQNFGVMQLGTRAKEVVTGVTLSHDSYLIAGSTFGDFRDPSSRVAEEKGLILRVKRQGLTPVSISEENYAR